MHAVPRPTGLALHERIGMPPCSACGSARPADCTCCRECNEPAVFGRLCEPHHRLTVERERDESIQQALWLGAQMGMVS